MAMIIYMSLQGGNIVQCDYVLVDYAECASDTVRYYIFEAIKPCKWTKNTSLQKSVSKNS